MPRILSFTQIYDWKRLLASCEQDSEHITLVLNASSNLLHVVHELRVAAPVAAAAAPPLLPYPTSHRLDLRLPVRSLGSSKQSSEYSARESQLR